MRAQAWCEYELLWRQHGIVWLPASSCDEISYELRAGILERLVWGDVGVLCRDIYVSVCICDVRAFCVRSRDL